MTSSQDSFRTPFSQQLRLATSAEDSRTKEAIHAQSPRPNASIRFTGRLVVELWTCARQGPPLIAPPYIVSTAAAYQTVLSSRQRRKTDDNCNFQTADQARGCQAGGRGPSSLSLGQTRHIAGLIGRHLFRVMDPGLRSWVPSDCEYHYCGCGFEARVSQLNKTLVHRA